MLVDAGGGLSQQVDVVTRLLHVEEEEDRDGTEGEHTEPDDRQDVGRDDELGEEEQEDGSERWEKMVWFGVSVKCGYLGSKC